MTPFNIFLAILVPCIWGIQAVMLKFGIGQFPPIFMVGLRFLLMSLLLIPFIGRIKGKVGPATLIGLAQGVAHFSLLYIGFKYSDVTSGMIVYQTNTIFTLMLGAIILREKVSSFGAAGTFICLLGVGLILGVPQADTSIGGLIIIAGSAFMFAVGNIVVRKFGPFDAVGLNSYVSTIAFPCLIGLSFLMEEGQIHSLMNASLAAWGALLYTALIGGVLAFILWYRLLSKFSVDKVSPYSLLMPFFSMIGSILILGEHVTIYNYVGAFITVAGIAVVQYGAKFSKKFRKADSVAVGAEA